MIASPPPFQYAPRDAESSNMRRVLQRPATATGASSATASSVSLLVGPSTANSNVHLHRDGSEPRRADMASSSTQRRATTSRLVFPAPESPSAPPAPAWVPSSVHECFVARNGRKLHAFHVGQAPYPLSYDREVLDMDVMNHLELVKLKGGTGSMVDFSSGYPRKALDLGCGTGSWIMEAAQQWPETRFVGFDLVPVQINLSVANSSIASRVEWVHGNFLTHKLPFADGEFDHVHIRFVGRGVPEDKWDTLLEEVHRVLCPGGSLNIIEEDLIFPTLPRSFTAKPRDRRKSTGKLGDASPGLLQHDHSLLEHLYFSVYERRFINIKPTSIMHGIMNIHFKHVYCGPRIDIPYPPPPVASDSTGSSSSSTTPSSPSNSDPLPLPTPGTSHAASRPLSNESNISEVPTISPPSGMRSSRSPSSDSSSLRSIGPIYHPVEGTPRDKLVLSSEERRRLKHAPLPVASFSKWTPRGLSLHLYNAYTAVLAMREAMWDELLLQLRDERKKRELVDAGWDPDEDEPRARYERLVQSYAADMQARTNFKDALSESLGWTAPPKAPLTKAEIVYELDRERERTVAKKLEEKMGFTEDTYMSRSVRGWCGFKDSKTPVAVNEPPPNPPPTA